MCKFPLTMDRLNVGSTIRLILYYVLKAEEKTLLSSLPGTKDRITHHAHFCNVVWCITINCHVSPAGAVYIMTRCWGRKYHPVGYANTRFPLY